MYLGVVIFHPLVLSFISTIRVRGKPHDRSERTRNKVAEVSDLYLPEFIVMYRDLLRWQREEKQRIRISTSCCETSTYDKVRTAYAQRVSHNGTPGASRILRFEMVWETVWPLLYLDVRPGMRVADIGAENSCLTPYFASRGCEAYGLDAFAGGYGTFFREEILRHCTDQTLTLDVSGRNGVAGKAVYRREDATRIRFPNGFFDRITCISTIEHIFDDVSVIKEITRILKPGGILALTTPFGLTYSQNEYKEGDELRHLDANRIYTEEALYAHLSNPSGLKIAGAVDFSVNERTWNRHHFFGQSPDFLSVALLLKKPDEH